MTTPDLNQPLADCLARIEAGESLDAALDRHPNMRCRLAPLVAAALAVQTMPPTPAPPTFRAALGAELARRAAARTVPPTAIPPATATATTPYSVQPWGSLLGVVLLVLLGLSGLLVALRWGEDWRRALVAGTEVGVLSHPPGVAAGKDNGADGAAAVQPSPVLRHGPPAARAEASAAARSSAARTRDAAAGTAEPRNPTSGSGDAGAVLLAPYATPTPTFAAAVPTPMPPASAAPPTTAEDSGASGNNRPPPSTPPPSPTATPTDAATATDMPTPAPSAAAGAVILSGVVQQGETPLVGLTVELYAAAGLADCLPEPSALPSATARTDDLGRFELAGLAAGQYRLSARGGATCLPRRWHTGENSPAVGGPCEDGVVELDLAEGVAARSINVLFEKDVVGLCP